MQDYLFLRRTSFVIDRKKENKMVKKTIGPISIALLLAIFFVTISPFMLGTTINDANEMKNAKFGFPVPFITQDLQTEYLSDYPKRFSMEIGFTENKANTRIDKVNYWLAVGIMFWAFLLLFYILYKFGVIKRGQNIYQKWKHDHEKVDRI
jgi:hypothetical protein